MEQVLRMKIELGRVYEFALQSGASKRIKVLGATTDGDELNIEVDGVSGIYADLQSALGDLYTEVRGPYDA